MNQNTLNRLLTTLILAVLGTGIGCQRADDPDESPAVVRTPPPPPTIGDENGPWVLRYFAPASGQLIMARKPADVPEGARPQVIVVPDDPSAQGPWLYVADLSKKAGESYAVRVVDRFELERKVAASRPPPPAQVQAATVASGEVILYRTAWCGYCEKAGDYLRMKGVPFVSKDIEREPGARQDMLQRAAKAGVPSSQLQGVPILYIKGRILSGFSRQAIDAALQGG